MTPKELIHGQKEIKVSSFSNFSFGSGLNAVSVASAIFLWSIFKSEKLWVKTIFGLNLALYFSIILIISSKLILSNWLSG